MSGRRSDDGSWAVVEERLAGLERMLNQRFTSMERELKQSIRHGDRLLETTVVTLTHTVQTIAGDVEGLDERVGVLEHTQIGWRASGRMLVAVFVFATSLTGALGTALGLFLG